MVMVINILHELFDVVRLFDSYWGTYRHGSFRLVCRAFCYRRKLEVVCDEAIIQICCIDFSWPSSAVCTHVVL